MTNKIQKKDINSKQGICFELKIPMLRKINKKEKRVFDTQELKKIEERFAYDSTEKETHYSSITTPMR